MAILTLLGFVMPEAGVTTLASKSGKTTRGIPSPGEISTGVAQTKEIKQFSLQEQGFCATFFC